MFLKKLVKTFFKSKICIECIVITREYKIENEKKKTRRNPNY